MMELFLRLKRITNLGKSYSDNWNEFTREWSSGYKKAMNEIDKELDSFIKEYENKV